MTRTWSRFRLICQCITCLSDVKIAVRMTEDTLVRTTGPVPQLAQLYMLINHRLRIESNGLCLKMHNVRFFFFVTFAIRSADFLCDRVFSDMDVFCRKCFV